MKNVIIGLSILFVLVVLGSGILFGYSQLKNSVLASSDNKQTQDKKDNDKQDSDNDSTSSQNNQESKQQNSSNSESTAQNSSNINSNNSKVNRSNVFDYVPGAKEHQMNYDEPVYNQSTGNWEVTGTNKHPGMSNQNLYIVHPDGTVDTQMK